MELKNFFSLNEFKMIKISPEIYEENGTEILFDCFKNLWLSEKHIENKICRSYLRNITLKYPSAYRKQRQELVNCDNYHPCRIFF